MPIGARCTFEDDNETKTGCIGWRLETYYVHNSRRADENKHLFIRVNASDATKQSPMKHVPPRDHTFERSNNSGQFYSFYFQHIETSDNYRKVKIQKKNLTAIT